MHGDEDINEENDFDPLQGLHLAATGDWGKAQLLGEEELHQVTSLENHLQTTEYGNVQNYNIGPKSLIFVV